MCEIVLPSQIIEDCLGTFGRIKIFSDYQKVSGPSQKYPDSSKTFGPSGKYMETFQTIWKITRLSENFPGYPENFPDHPENIKTIRKLSRLSGNFLYHPENIQPIRKLSKGSGNFPVQFQGLRAKTFRTRKNFPDGNATMPRWFLRL